MRCFWGLDKSLAYARHFPAIHWLTSYSEYLQDLSHWYQDNVSPKFVDYRNRDIIRLLRIKKDKTRICSLSKDYRHILLWSHYADGHKGCCIEVSMRDPGATLRDINYVSELQTVDRAVDAEELLSYKSKSWEYEQEIRVFGRSKYRRVYLHQIIFGMRVSENDFRFYENLINRINPDIAVRKISEHELETGYERY